MAEPEYKYDGNEFEQVEGAASPERQQNLLQNRIDERKNYLKHLKATSKQLAQQIRQINEQLDKRMSKLADKPLTKKTPQAPADPQTGKQLQEKYNELDSLRQQIKRIKAKEFNMQFAVDRVKELRALLKLEQQEVDKLHREIQSYKKPLTEHQKASTADDNEQIPAYTEEISRLKDKIKEITSQQHHQTDEILELGRRHKQMATSNLGRTKSTPKRQILDDTLTNSIAEARRKYEDIGRKLEILRVRRNILLQEDGHLEDRKKLLQSYQSKYQELKKVQQNQSKPIRKHVMKAEHNHPAEIDEDKNDFKEEPVDDIVDKTEEVLAQKKQPATNTRDVDIQQSLPTP